MPTYLTKIIKLTNAALKKAVGRKSWLGNSSKCFTLSNYPLNLYTFQNNIS